MILILSELTGEDGMGGRALPIRTDIMAAEMRCLGRRERDRAAAARMMAIAGALEGLPRGEAARLAGMERQALRDAVLRYNAEGLAGGTTVRARGVVRAWTRQAGANCASWCWTGRTSKRPG